MKTINEAAKEFANKGITGLEGIKLSALKGFEAGVAFAQEWKSTDEELPEAFTLIIVKEDTEVCLLSYMTSSGVFVSNETGRHFDNVTRWRYVDIN
jgi:hypothetical protein